MNKHKYFNEKKYYLNQNYWMRTTHPSIQLSHDVWNYNNPNDIIKDGEVIHHKNEDSSDDRIENLEKMTNEKHISLHHAGSFHSEKTKQKMRESHFDMSGKKSPNWKGGVKIKQLHLCHRTVERKCYYEIHQRVNSLGEILGSTFNFHDKRKLRR